jgi:hypothetical protein
MQCEAFPQGAGRKKQIPALARTEAMLVEDQPPRWSVIQNGRRSIRELRSIRRRKRNRHERCSMSRSVEARSH